MDAQNSDRRVTGSTIMFPWLYFCLRFSDILDNKWHFNFNLILTFNLRLHHSFKIFMVPVNLIHPWYVVAALTDGQFLKMAAQPVRW